MKQQRNERAKNQAWSLKHLFIPSTLSSLIGEQNTGVLGARVLLNTQMSEAGSPSDPVEQMMLEQLIVAHYRLAQLALRADQSESVEAMKILNAAANRLLSEFRRLALALRTYRTPPSQKSIAFIKQQNVAQTQDVRLVDHGGSSGEKIVIARQGEVEAASQSPQVGERYGGRLANLDEEPSESCRRETAEAMV